MISRFHIHRRPTPAEPKPNKVMRIKWDGGCRVIAGEVGNYTLGPDVARFFLDGETLIIPMERLQSIEISNPVRRWSWV